MDSGYWFVSYSRQQLYFAESLAISLRSHGIETWFDLQRLNPGVEWEASIDKALTECNGLIFIASRTSLESDNVCFEVSKALERKKRIYVVLFEAVDLTFTDPKQESLRPELLSLSRVDFRGSFKRGVDQLVSLINLGGEATFSLPHPTPFGLPTRLPMGVACVSISLLSMIALSLLMVRLFADAVNGYWTLLYIGVSIYLIYNLLGKFLRHEAGMEELWRWCLWSFFTTLWASSVMLILNTYTSDEIWLPFLFGIIVWITFAVSLQSDDLLRWLPLGDGNARTRRRINRPVYNRKAGTKMYSYSKKYALYYEPADQPIAKQVIKTMSANRHDRQPSGDEIDYCLVIVSGHSSSSNVSRLIKNNHNLILIVASSVTLHLKSGEFVPYQWLDYRQQSRETLQYLAEYMGQHIILSRVGQMHGLPIVPEYMTQAVIPKSIQRSVTFIRLLGGGCVAIAATFLLSPFLITTITPGTPIWATITATLFIALLVIVPAVIFFELTRRIIARQISLWRYWILMLIVGIPSMGIFPPSIPVFLLFFVLSWRSFRDWLPARKGQEKHSDNLSVPSIRYRWQYLGVSAVYFVMSLYITIGFERFLNLGLTK